MLFTLAAAHTGKATTEHVLSSSEDQTLTEAADLPAKLTQYT